MRIKFKHIQQVRTGVSNRVEHSGIAGFFNLVPASGLWSGQKEDRAKPLILAVDNDPVSRAGVVEHLSEEGLVVEIADNEKKALERLGRAPFPDLVLLDLMTPENKGYETCSRIRKTHSPSELPVILLTSRYNPDELVKGMTLGANDYLAKPIEKEELKARVKTQLRLRQAVVAVRESEARKAEVARQKRRGNALKMAQRKLSNMLHTIDDPVMVVNPSREVAFVNRACATLLNISPKALLGASVFSLFDNPEDPALDILAACFDTAIPPYPSVEGVVLRGGEGRMVTVGITLGPMALADKDHCFLILKTFKKKSRLFTGWIRKELVAGPQEGKANKRDLLVRVMNLSVDLWNTVTGTTRIELAEQSGLWNVYLGKDGWARTQTLDKYLDLASLPKRPKCKTVVYTADFVLTACPVPNTATHRELRETLKKLRHIL